MIRIVSIVAAAVACSIGTTAAVARDGWHGDGYGHSRWAAPGYRHYAPRGYYYGPGYWAAPAYAYAYPSPYWAYTPPPPPVVVERIYEVPRVYEAPPPPAVQRQYAEMQPPPPPQPPATSRPAAPVPRLDRYTLSARELFGFDEATIRGANTKLDEIAEAMKRNREIDHVAITGYTDRIGTDAYNLKLSQRRADAVKRYLVARGVEASRLTATGKGKANPVVQCNDKDREQLIKCLEPNRRVEVEQIVVERVQR